MKQEERETGLSVRKICRKIKQKRNGRRQWAASGRRGNGRERERERPIMILLPLTGASLLRGTTCRKREERQKTSRCERRAVCRWTKPCSKGQVVSTSKERRRRGREHQQPPPTTKTNKGVVCLMARRAGFRERRCTRDTDRQFVGGSSVETNGYRE